MELPRTVYVVAVTTATFGGESDGVADVDVRCPWKGLDNYEPSDGALFVGRERVVRQMLDTMERASLAGVVGASGSGKSSLLLAGLSQHANHVVTVRPGADPRASWRAALGELADRPPEIDAGDRPLVIVDQLEEVFTSCDDEDERAAFLDELVETAASGRVAVVVGLRSDHYGSCAPYARFAEALSSAHVLLGAPTHDELRRMITVPAHAASLRLERGLDDEIVDDVLGEAGALPLLSHALRETWLRRDGDLLTRDAYRRAGGVRGAIARTAEETWSALPAPQQAAVREILTRLGSTVAEVESSHRVPIAELVPPGDADVEAALDALVRARLVTVDNATAEVTHEAVFRAWPRLRDWLADDRDVRRVLGQLRASASAWDDEGRDDAALLRGTRLQAVLDLAGVDGHGAYGRTLDAVSRAFVDASAAAARRDEAEQQESVRRERRRNRRLRVLLAAAIALAVVLAATGAFALRQRTVALDRQRTADARRLAAVAAGVREDRLDLAALLSIEAVEGHDDLDTRGALLSTLTDQTGLQGYIHQSDATVDSAIDPSGEVLAMPGADYRLELWDVSGPSPELARTVDLGEEVAAMTVRFTDDGLLLVGDSAGGVHLVDPTSGSFVMTSAIRADGAVWALALDPSGRIVAGGAEDTLVRLFDATSGAAVGEPLSGPGDVVYAVEFSPDGRVLVAGGGDGALFRWDTETWEPVGDPIVFDGGIWDMAWIDESTLSVATDVGVQFVDPSTGATVQPPLSAHDGITYRVVPIDDGATLVTSGEDGLIRFWDLATRAPTRPALHPHAAGVRVSLAVDAARMVSSSDDGTTAVWDLRGGSSQATPLAQRPNGRTQVVTSADGRIFTGDRSGVLREWRIDGTPVEGSPFGDLPIGDVPISGLSISADGTRLAVARDEGAAQVIDVVSGRSITPVIAVGQLTSAVVLDPAGRLLVTVQGDRDCMACFAIHDLDDPTAEPRRLRPPGLGPDRMVAGAAAAFDPSGSVLVTGDRSGWVDAWEIGTGTHLWGLQLPRGVRSLAFSPDGSRVAVGGNTGMLLELDAVTGERRQQLDGHAGPVVTVAYAPDGSLLASASSQDHEMRIWRLDLGLTVGRPVWLGFDGSATVAWTDGGRQAVAPHLLAGAMIFDLDGARSLDAACRLAGRNLTLVEWRQYFGTVPYRRTCADHPAPDPADGSTADPVG